MIECIVVIIVLFVFMAIPCVIGLILAYRYSLTLPESEREQYWMDINKSLDELDRGLL